MGILDGVRVVVTGAGRGLGRAYAIAMAREGASVVVNDIDRGSADKVAAEIIEAHGRAAANGDSVADRGGARSMVEQCVSEFGDIDVLVNNAGIFHSTPVWEETPEQLDRIIAVNLTGTFNTTRHALEHMMPRREGCIINVTSGAQSGIAGYSAYGATKAGIAAFTYAWAMELAPYNIRVNAISPFAFTNLDPKSPGPPVWPAEAVAPLAVFLASRDASCVTGQVVRIQGDVLSLYSHPRSIVPVVRPGGWTVPEIQKSFKSTLGQNLEPVGLGATQYEYYGGLTKK